MTATENLKVYSWLEWLHWRRAKNAPKALLHLLLLKYIYKTLSIAPGLYMYVSVF